jgi:hypothetical protein
VRHLDRLLAKLDNPPFDRVARLWVDLGGALDGPRELTLSSTTVSGNARRESPKKRIEAVRIEHPEELELRVRWVLRVTQERGLSTPRIEETYEARPIGYEGPLDYLEAELDCRLDAAKALLFPQVVTDVSASFIPGERGSYPACFLRARFQGVLVTPHVIEVKIFDADLEAPEDERWARVKAWASRAALGHGCTIVPDR